MLISTDSEYQVLVSNLLLSISIFHCNIPSMIPVYTDKHSQLILSFSYVSSPHSSLAPICLSFSLYHDVYMIYLHIYGVETNRNGCIKHNSTLSNCVVVNFKSKLKADKYPFVLKYTYLGFVFFCIILSKYKPGVSIYILVQLSDKKHHRFS